MTADKKTAEWRALKAEVIALDVQGQSLTKKAERIGDDPEAGRIIAEEAQALASRGEKLRQRLEEFERKFGPSDEGR